MRRTIVCTLLAVLLAMSGSAVAVDAQEEPIGPGTSEDACATPAVDGFGFDAYGGWKGLSRPATGRFTVAEVDGRWWFFTPLGNAFYANGATGIRPTGGGATAAGVNDYLTGILATHGSLSAWADSTFQRTCELGIRTLGGWNAAENIDLFAGRLAYTVNVDVYAAMPAVSGGPPSVKPRRDVFAPDALARARSVAADPLVVRCGDDPWCLGVFVENEQPYAPGVLVGGSHLDAYLAQPADSPGKAEVQRFMAERYDDDLAAFNTTWGTTLDTWDDLKTVTALGTCPTGIGLDDDACAFNSSPVRWADRVAFEAHVAGRNAQIADQVLDEVEPAMLNLGPRLAIEPQVPEVLAAIAGPVDVLSVNDYDLGTYGDLAAASLPAAMDRLPYDPLARLDRIAEITAKPIFVSEWFYRLPRPGGSHPFFLPERPDGPSQAAAVTAFLDGLHANPAVVGESWFQWADQPAAGRASDGENQLHGIVDIDDEIRQPLFDTMAAANGDVFARRLGPADGPFTARFSAPQCRLLDAVADANDLTRAGVLRVGVRFLDLLAATAPQPPPPPEPNVGSCAVIVDWSEEDLAIVDRAASAWGLDADQLHGAGGRFIFALIYWLAFNG